MKYETAAVTFTCKIKRIRDGGTVRQADKVGVYVYLRLNLYYGTCFQIMNA